MELAVNLLPLWEGLGNDFCCGPCRDKDANILTSKLAKGCENVGIFVMARATTTTIATIDFAMAESGCELGELNGSNSL
jgi:hypothetical protein